MRKNGGGRGEWRVEGGEKEERRERKLRRREGKEGEEEGRG